MLHAVGSGPGRRAPLRAGAADRMGLLSVAGCMERPVKVEEVKHDARPTACAERRTAQLPQQHASIGR
ncbi:MAG TPA: hypothetical protein VFW98_06705 [Gemmatimonadaceae bacterium]|nr:hypothetical protein [Gemmatimonadaceae bacterium]